MGNIITHRFYSMVSLLIYHILIFFAMSVLPAALTHQLRLQEALTQSVIRSQTAPDNRLFFQVGISHDHVTFSSQPFSQASNSVIKIWQPPLIHIILIKKQLEIIAFAKPTSFEHANCLWSLLYTV
jgi:hypothetical protein